MRNALIKVVEKIEARFILSNVFPENRAVYEIMSKTDGSREAEDDSMAACCMLDI